MPPDHMSSVQSSEVVCLPQEPQTLNEAQDLLLLQDYVHRLTNTLRTLEDTHAVLQQTELLAGVINEQDCRRPDGSVGMVLVLPALTDCRWWFESLLVHSGVSSATRRKATGADHKKSSVEHDLPLWVHPTGCDFWSPVEADTRIFL